MESDSAVVLALDKLASRVLSTKWLAAASVVVLATSLLYCSRIEIDLDDCYSVMQSGRWVHGHWHPYYCILQQEPSRGVVEKCLSGDSSRHHMSFLGSTSLVNTFKKLVDHLDNDGYSLPPSVKEASPLLFTSADHKLIAEYLWRPLLDEQVLLTYEQLIEQPIDNMSTSLFIHQHPGFQAVPPHVTLKDLASAVNRCKEKISALVSLQKQYLEQQQRKSNPFIIMLVSELSGTDSTLQGARRCQEFAEQKYKTLSEESEAVRGHLVLLKMPKFRTGPGRGLTSTVEIAIHFLCNSRQYATCCLPQDTTPFTSSILPLFAILVAIQLGLWLVRITGGTLPLEPYLEGTVDLDKFYTVLGLSVAITLVTLYACLCDRMEVFFKENLWASLMLLCLLMVVIVCLGFLRIDRCSTSHVGPLPRELGVEARGWLVLVLMATEYTGMDGSGPWRLALAMLVFLNAVSHCYYFWSTGDFSLLRVARVVFRQNYLCMCFSLALRTPYSLYTLPSLFTLSFLLVYLIMAVFPSLTAEKINVASRLSMLAVAVKLLFIALLVFLFTTREEVWSLWQLPFLRSLLGDEGGSLDKWISATHSVRYLPLLAVPTCYLLASNRSKAPTVAYRKLCLIVILLGNAGYLLMVVQMGPDSWGGGVLQDVFVVLPILSYIIARSWNDHVRGSYSAVYHHCGAMGTELYVTFRHVMLAHGGNGILAMFPGLYSVNMLATLVVWLLCVESISQAVSAVNGYSPAPPARHEHSQTLQEELPPA